MKAIVRPILRFFGVFLLVYACLVGLSLVPRVSSAAKGIYQKTSLPILQSLLPKAYLQFRPDEANQQMVWVEYASKEKVDQQMDQASRTGKKAMDVKGDRTPFDFYNVFFTFWLLFLALMLVSPLSWQSKLVRILIGSLVYYGYSVFKLYLSYLNTFSQPHIGIYELGEGSFVPSLLSMMTLGINLLLVIVLWAVLAFDQNNWRAFMEKVDVLQVPKKA